MPDDLASRLENLAVISHRSTVSAGAIVHAGVVQPVSDLGFPSLRNWPVEVPGLNSGLPFRLVRTRNAAGAGQTLEPAGAGAFVDLVVDRIAITVPGLRPATLVPTAPAVVAHLLPDSTKSGVKIVGAGVVRIDLTGSGDVVRFVDWPDPFDPAAPSGAVYRVTFDPVSFYIGGSEIGMVVDRLVFDASTQVTPPEIIARRPPQRRGACLGYDRAVAGRTEPTPAASTSPREGRLVGRLELRARGGQRGRDARHGGRRADALGDGRDRALERGVRLLELALEVALHVGAESWIVFRSAEIALTAVLAVSIEDVASGRLLIVSTCF